MLNLGRTKNQSILIGENIEVKVIEFGTTQYGNPYVNLGIEAPGHVQIVRKEIAKKYNHNK